MWKKETNPECCTVFERLPRHIDCFMPDLNKEADRLSRMHKRSFVKNDWILGLAKPKIHEHMYFPSCPCRLKKSIELIYLDQRANTRTEQLALPKPRHLLTLKEQVRRLFPPDRILNLNRLIRKSLLSLYSRLHNVQPPKEVVPLRKWDRAEWNKHLKKLRKLARPKVPKLPPKVPNKRMPLKKMKRYKYLSKPLMRVVSAKPDWTLTKAMKQYVATDRTTRLAAPTVRDTSMLYQDLPVPVPTSALKAKASKRTKTLAEPPAIRTAQLANAELRENPFAISPNALKAKASKRTKDLAEPREYENKHIRDDPYAISPAALKAKAKPRTIELAKPKSR